jgi:hypothetical protein
MNSTSTPSAVASIPASGAAPGRRTICAAAVIAVAGIATVTGCSASPHVAAASTATVTASAAAVPASTSPRAATSAPAVPATPVSAPPASAIPALGHLVGVFAHGAGFGQVKPSRIFNGGDPTGLVSSIVWKSWGGASAVGTGTSDYVGSGQTVATGSQEPATVVAFNLGTCDGKLMYRAVEWYFPQHGQAFNASQYENICAGSYVPNS